MWGTLTDISLHGCYVEMNTTFPVDTKVESRPQVVRHPDQAPGTVRTSYPLLGMGICFAEIEAGTRAQLKQLLDALTGRNTVSTRRSGLGKKALKNTLAVGRPESFLDEMTEFFQKNQTLSREEFHRDRQTGSPVLNPSSRD